MFFLRFVFIWTFSWFFFGEFVLSQTCESSCCKGTGSGISYCDLAAGRYVCNSGQYSVCYCSHSAIMDLQLIKGCCLWHGGEAQIDPSTGEMICNDGSISHSCGRKVSKISY